MIPWKMKSIRSWQNQRYVIIFMVTTLQHHSERNHWNQRRSNRNDSVTLVSISCYLHSFSCENSRFQYLRVCFPSTLQFFSFITHTDHIFTFQESNENSAQQLVDVKGKNLKVTKRYMEMIISKVMMR